MQFCKNPYREISETCSFARIPIGYRKLREREHREPSSLIRSIPQSIRLPRFNNNQDRTQSGTRLSDVL
ncbi:hypothetical protein OUZ56_000306 [Daphnia magna]|uniref:Uncharacterized protein n=1 Tax=Daphnia magna TaxID=35525 RepID=A0ABR0A002_9CRUS|nr:hypothetical protein OUZ56_000306 [Daphnia magna]